MFLPRLLRHLLVATVLLPGIAGAQLVRQANTTLTLPDELPNATGYTTSNALGSVTFSNPICTAFPAGETNRLYVLEKGSGTAVGRIQVLNDLVTPTAGEVATFMDLETYLA